MCDRVGCPNQGNPVDLCQDGGVIADLSICDTCMYRWEYFQARARLDANYLRKANIDENVLSKFMCDRVDTHYYDNQWRELEELINENS